MAVLLLLKDVILKVCKPGDPGCEWFSQGQGIAVNIEHDDGTFLTCKDHNGKEFTLPCASVALLTAVPKLTSPPPLFCLDCDQRHPEEAVWEVPRRRFLCNRCYAARGGPFKRYEVDPETKDWVQTHPINRDACVPWEE